MGTQPPPQFLAYFYCGQTAGWITMELSMEVGLGPDHIVLDGDPAPLPKRGQSNQFSVCFYCGQTVGCTKMSLGMEVGLSPFNFVFVGTQLPPEKLHPPHPIFGPCLFWPNGWMDEDATWYTEVNLGPGHIVLHGVPAIRERGTTAPSFRPVSIGATVAHLSYC